MLGEAFKEALGDKKGIKRYGCKILPMDESLATVTVDISGRPYLAFRTNMNKDQNGSFDVELLEEFFKSFVNSSQITLHINQEFGANFHHQTEAIFKAFAKVLDLATQIDERVQGVPSTKGVL